MDLGYLYIAHQHVGLVKGDVDPFHTAVGLQATSNASTTRRVFAGAVHSLVTKDGYRSGEGHADANP